MDGRVDGRTDGWKDGRMDRWIAVRMDRRADGWMDETDGCINGGDMAQNMICKNEGEVGLAIKGWNEIFTW